MLSAVSVILALALIGIGYYMYSDGFFKIRTQTTTYTCIVTVKPSGEKTITDCKPI